jgi:hypothetical protein
MKILTKTIKTYALTKYPYTNARLLAASTAESLTIPAWAKYAVFSGNIDCWISERGTAVIPAADITDGTSPIYIPGGTKEVRNIEGVSAISVISASAGIFTTEYYSGDEE